MIPKTAMRVKPLLLLAGALSLGSCATVREVMALRDVDFALDRVTQVRLAGVDLTGVSSFAELGFADAGRLALAVSERDLPLTLDVHVSALNPSENTVDARLVRMDWTLLLEGRETISGVFDDETVLSPGQPRDLTFPVSVNLVEFFEGSARDLANIALALSGQESESTEIALRASPVVRTVLGPMRYPEPITVARGTVGGR